METSVNREVNTIGIIRRKKLNFLQQLLVDFPKLLLEKFGQIKCERKNQKTRIYWFPIQEDNFHVLFLALQLNGRILPRDIIGIVGRIWIGLQRNGLFRNALPPASLENHLQDLHFIIGLHH